jgi:hypothetical protein
VGGPAVGVGVGPIGGTVMNGCRLADTLALNSAWASLGAKVTDAPSAAS